jgi:hypothetical protein
MIYFFLTIKTEIIIKNEKIVDVENISYII